MTDVFLSLDEERERKLRELSRLRYGGKKGSLSHAAADAIELLYSAQKQPHEKKSLERLVQTMEKGFKIGLASNKAYESRADIYAGRFSGIN
ncbi:hypothetical protein HY993_02500 [Candidatus Micrarchaeota archaeon]|nr:hypothetical protein [Candidatus Micrarchaeota archaeon]